MSRQIHKSYELKEDIIIPKGTIFTHCNKLVATDLYESDISDGMINSTMAIRFYDDLFKENGKKFKEV